MAADKRVNVVIGGDSTGAQKALGDVGNAAEKSAGRATSAFKTMGTTLSAGSGGALEPIGRAFDAIQKGLETTEQHGKTAGGVLLGLGAAGVAAGGLLMAAAEQDTQAQQQLDQAIQNTGDSADTYSGQIDDMVSHNEKFGDTASQSEQALRILVQSTGDTGKALGLMSEAADLAAAKHESLTAATQQLALIQEGKGARTLQQFGLNLADFKGKVDAGTLAVQALGDKISGQAVAASDTFGGHLKALGVTIEDDVAKLGQKYGPALMGVSAAASVVGGAVEGASAVFGHFTKSAEEATVGAEGLAAAEGEAEAAGIGLGTGLGAAAIALGALYIAFRSQGTIIDDNATVTKQFTDALKDLKGSASDAFTQLGQGALEGDKAVATLNELGLTQGQVMTAMNGSVSQLGDLYDALGKTTAGNKELSDAFQDLRFRVGDIRWGEEVAGATEFNEAISKLGASGFQELASSSGISDAALATLNAAMADGTVTAGELNLSSGDLAAVMDLTKKAMDAQAESAKESAAQAAAVGVKFQTMSDAAKSATSDLGQFKNALDTVIGGGLSAAKATDDYYKALDDLTAAVKKNGASLDEHTDKGRANREAIIASTQAAFNQADAMVKQGATVDQASGFINTYIENLKAQLGQLGLNKDEVDAYVTSLGLTPDKVETAIKMSGQQQAHDDVVAHLAQLDTIPKDKQTEIQALIDHGNFAQAQAEIDALTSPKTVQIRADISQFLAKIPIIGQAASTAVAGGRAAGGPVDAGKTYLVGEEGPELVTMGGAGVVTPHNETVGGVTIHQTNNFYGPVGPDQIGDMLEQKMNEAAQQVFAGVR